MKTRSLEVRLETSSKEKENEKKSGWKGKLKIFFKKSALVFLVFENFGICQSLESWTSSSDHEILKQEIITLDTTTKLLWSQL